MKEQKNLFGETERVKFILYANKKNTIFCNVEENGFVETPIVLSELESLFIEDKFNTRLIVDDYLYLAQTDFRNSEEYKAWEEDQTKNPYKYTATWKPVDFNYGKWKVEKGKISNGYNKVSLSNFTNLQLGTIETCFEYNTQYNYFRLIINDIRIYIVGEFE
ncbi:MAG: hypothetical protein FWB90_00690 [Fibromonadales bacterium]|nr:hypothetical protein [Fibromonadales bacterium]